MKAPVLPPAPSLALALLVGTCWLGQLAGAPGAAAHTRSLSHSSWQLAEDGAQVKLRIPRLELTRVGLDAPPADARLRAAAGAYLAARIVLYGGGASCERDSEITPRSARDGWAAFSWSVHCPAGPPARIETEILLEAAPSHLHFARVSDGQQRVFERVLTEEARTMPVARPDEASNAGRAGDDPAASGASIGRYVGIGVAHILTGWDHIAFVIALLLLATRLGEVARLVTGFTIAHSLTLALAVLGVVKPVPGAVEALIGFSVALVATESAWSLAGRPKGVVAACIGVLVCVCIASLAGVSSLPPITAFGLLLFTSCHFLLLERLETHAARTKMRATLAFAFGLVHGFGFAGILGDMQLPETRLVPALFGFNVGVELGQLGVVALAWPTLRLLRAQGDGRFHRLALDGACAATCALGVFWFVSRSFTGG